MLQDYVDVMLYSFLFFMSQNKMLLLLYTFVYRLDDTLFPFCIDNQSVQVKAYKKCSNSRLPHQGFVFSLPNSLYAFLLKFLFKFITKGSFAISITYAVSIICDVKKNKFLIDK